MRSKRWPVASVCSGETTRGAGGGGRGSMLREFGDQEEEVSIVG
jgi:hypothetical protein